MLVTYPVDPPAESAQGGKPTWFDLADPSDDERTSVERVTGFRLPTREQLSEVESSSRVNIENKVLYLSIPGVIHVDNIEEMPSPVGFVLSSEALVTIRYARLHSFEQVTDKLRQDDKGKAPTSAEIFTQLVEAMVDFSADMLEQLGTELGRISRLVFRRGQKRKRTLSSNLRLRNTLVDIGETGERLSEIGDTLQGMQRIVLFGCERGEWIPADLHSRLKTARDDLISLSHYETQLFEKAQFLLDAVLGFINTEQNDIFRVLTIVSVVGIPPTLIASMYGMNFKNMPELSWEWGYQWGLSLIALSIVVPIIWFKRRGWW
jgi:magnesium transporter